MLFKTSKKELKFLDGHVIDYMFVYPQNSYVKTLIPNAIVFGAGAFGGWLGHEGGALRMRFLFL